MSYQKSIVYPLMDDIIIGVGKEIIEADDDGARCELLGIESLTAHR